MNKENNLRSKEMQMLDLLNPSCDGWVEGYINDNFTNISKGKLISKKIFECDYPSFYLKYQILYECKNTCVSMYLVPIEVELPNYLVEKCSKYTSDANDLKDNKIKITDYYIFSRKVLDKLFEENLMPVSLIRFDCTAEYYLETNYTICSLEEFTHYWSPESFASIEELKDFLEKEIPVFDDNVLAPIYLLFASQLYGFDGHINEGYAEHEVMSALPLPYSYFYPYEWDLYEASR